MMTEDLFPETTERAETTNVEWRGKLVTQWDHPRVVVRLVSEWDPEAGWRVGWFVQLDRAVDEWHPRAPDRHKEYSHYPWYRLSEMPRSRKFGIAAGQAARAVKIVLEQMLEYAEDTQALEDAREVSSVIESQAQEWLVNA